MLVFAALIGIKIYISSPKQVFKFAINKAFDEVIDVLDQDKDKTVITYDFNTNVVLPKNMDDQMHEAFELINNISFSGSIAADMDQRIMQMEAGLKYKKSELASLKAYIQDNEAYISLGQLFDKYISIDFEDDFNIDYSYMFESINEEDIDDIVVILEQTKKAFTNSLEDEYFEKEKVDGMTKNTLVLNDKNTSKIFKSICKNLKENEKFLQSYSSLSDMSEKEIKETLESIIESSKEIEDSDSENKILISIYTKGLFNGFKKFELICENEDEEVSFEFTKEDKENYSFKLEYSDNGQKETISGKLGIVKDKNKTSISFDVEPNIEDLDGLVLGFDLTYSVTFDAEISKINTKDSISLSKFSTDEKSIQTIMENITNNEVLAELLTDIEKISGGSILPQHNEYTLSYNGVSVKFNVSDEYELQSSTLDSKVVKNYYLEANYKLADDFATCDEFFAEVENLRSYYEENTSNFKLSGKQSMIIDGKTYYYVDLSYDVLGETYYDKYLCTPISNGVIFYVLIESINTPITNSLINNLI